MKRSNRDYTADSDVGAISRATIVRPHYNSGSHHDRIDRRFWPRTVTLHPASRCQRCRMLRNAGPLRKPITLTSGWGDMLPEHDVYRREFVGERIVNDRPRACDFLAGWKISQSPRPGVAVRSEFRASAEQTGSRGRRGRRRASREPRNRRRRSLSRCWRRAGRSLPAPAAHPCLPAGVRWRRSVTKDAMTPVLPTPVVTSKPNSSRKSMRRFPPSGLGKRQPGFSEVAVEVGECVGTNHGPLILRVQPPRRNCSATRGVVRHSVELPVARRVIAGVWPPPHAPQAS